MEGARPAFGGPPFILPLALLAGTTEFAALSEPLTAYLDAWKRVRVSFGGAPVDQSSYIVWTGYMLDL